MVRWLSFYEPTTEVLKMLPEIAKEVWEKRQERATQDARTLKAKLEEQRCLNSQAIKAKLKGELLEEDFAALKLSITEETIFIQKQLQALESERSTMEELIAQTQSELIDLPSAWAKAGLSEERRELFEMLFPEGLAWSDSMGFLNSQNMSIMQDLAESLNDQRILSSLASPTGFEPVLPP